MNIDCITLTPNRRLAATLLNQHHTEQIKKARCTWRTPIILPLQAWLQTLWHSASMQTLKETPPLLLTASQAILVWENILSASPESSLLLQSEPTAELAAKAHELLKLWQIQINHPMLTLTEDGQAFQRWATAFVSKCKRHDWIDFAGLPDYLAKKISLESIPLPKQIRLAGFTEVAPQFQKLFDEMRAAGCDIAPVENNNSPQHQTAHTVCCADEDTEIRTMARWAKACLDKQALSDDSITIGCIIPRLDTQRERVLQIFSDIFSDPNTLTSHHEKLPFNISAGKKLSDWPPIRSAFLLLDSLIRTLDKGEEARLKVSPFTKTTRADSTALPIDTSLSPREWAEHLSTYLKSAGWPGERSLSSDEYQICQRWLELMEEFSTFHLLNTEMRLKEAIESLHKLANRTVYQPRTPTAPVQISGILEAAGQPYTYLWITGMDDTQWPFPPRPNPLIPIALARQLQMPHASAERELHYCRALFAQLRDQTAHLICSYAGQLDDSSLRPASLLQGITILPATDLPQSADTPPAMAVFETASVERYKDETASPVSENETLRGGSRIFNLQAACPFRAFAEIRLHARQVEDDTPGLDAKTRGRILHKTLELFWKQVSDSRKMHALTTESRISLIENCAMEAMQLCIQKTPQDARALHMEWERMVRLASAWLDVEKDRPDFRVIGCEEPITVTLSGITLDLRMDRVDELADGTHMIIDYKTGKNPSPNQWMGDRPDEPQLPLYCISSTDDNLKALAFGIVHPEAIKLTGLSAKETGIKHIKPLPQWQEQMFEWRIHLNLLAERFTTGHAPVDPKNGHATCEHCHLQTLCRIYEKNAHVS